LESISAFELLNPQRQTYVEGLAEEYRTLLENPDVQQARQSYHQSYNSLNLKSLLSLGMGVLLGMPFGIGFYLRGKK
jgi:hypothetical protein